MTVPIVFVHGLCGSRDNFCDLQPHFPGAVSFDLIGFGREKKPPSAYDKDVFLAFLESRITAPSVLVGHSMGAILAKEFAGKHPHLVKRIYAIGYPLQATPERMAAALRRDRFMAHYLDGNWAAKLMCQTKCCYKYLLLPFGLLFFRRRFLSFWHYFSHTYTSAANTIKNTILRDDYSTILPLKEKMVFIVGTNDRYVDPELLAPLSHARIPGMGHFFWGYETQIADIIRRDMP